MNRNLDGFYFRVKRDDKYENICFSDLTEEEQDKFLGSMNQEGLKRMCKALASCLKSIGDQFDIYAE